MRARMSPDRYDATVRRCSAIVASMTPARKMLVALPEGDAAETEGLWVQTTDQPDQFVVDNIPIFAKGISRGDTVLADAHGKLLFFRGVVRRGGNITYHLLVRDQSKKEEWSRLLASLERLGAATEGVDNRLIAFDISGSMDRAEVERLLEESWLDETAWYELVCDPQGSSDSATT